MYECTWILRFRSRSGVNGGDGVVSEKGRCASGGGIAERGRRGTSANVIEP